MFDIHTEGLIHYAVLTTCGHEHYFCAQGRVSMPDGSTVFYRTDQAAPVVIFPADAIVSIVTGYSLIDAMLRMDLVTEALRSEHHNPDNSLGLRVNATTQILYAV